MIPRRIIAVATASNRTTLVARSLQRWEIGGQGSLVCEKFFSSRPDEDAVVGNHNPQQGERSTEDPPINQPLEMSQSSENPDRQRSQSGERAMADRKKKWKAPFWLPPPSSSPSSKKRNQRHKPSRFQLRSANRYRDASLPCRKHLDPSNSMRLPTSNWVQIFGALPMTSLEEVLVAIENVLKQEADRGAIVDLDADWNPHRDGEDPPLVPSTLEVPVKAPRERREYSLDQEDVEGISGNNGNGGISDFDDSGDNDNTVVQMECFRVVKAHVVLSPFGRPTGWNLQLANPSMVHALLSYSQNARVRGNLRIGWKFAKVQEHFPRERKSYNQTDDTRNMLVVSDSMVRFENCPPSLTEDYLRHMLSRYELTPRGSTIIRWKGQTSDGRVPPLTFVVRFANPAYARAAVRELQGTMLEGRSMKLIQYPRQLM